MTFRLLRAAGAILMTASLSSGASSDAPQLVEKEGCVVERHIVVNEGLRLVTWIMRPKGDGPFPMVVWNHGSRIWFDDDGKLHAAPERSTIDVATPCWPSVSRRHWLYLLPEGRGYGGSEGPNPLEAAYRMDSTLQMLQGRARDANAAAAWAKQRRDVDPRRVAIVGPSHGGVVTLLAAAAAPYSAVVAQATGASYGNNELGAVLLHNATAHIRAPLMFQHFENDTLVPIEGARRIYEWAVQFRPQIVWRSYPGVPGVEGHDIYAKGHNAQWRPDHQAFLEAAFASGVPALAPEAPPALRTHDALPFSVPADLSAGAQVWSGRYEDTHPPIDTLLILNGDTAVYAWKRDGSRGYKRTGVQRRGNDLTLAVGPSTTVTYSPLPENGWLAEYASHGQVSRARLTPTVLPR